MLSSKHQLARQIIYTCGSLLTILFIFFVGMGSLLTQPGKADVIMFDGQGEPEIIENDDISSDVVLMPGMNGLMMNDDFLL